MLHFDNNQKVLLELLQAGLWNKEVRLAKYDEIDYPSILRVAEEQSVVGLVTAGLEKVIDTRIPQAHVLQFIGSSLQIEQQNQSMNLFVASLIEKLRDNDVYVILVKGQGIAQCYDKPLWRSSGDVDLLLSPENYKKADKFLSSIADSVDEEIAYSQHIAMTINGWSVELHGSLRGELWRSIDRVVDEVQDAVFNGGSVRSWQNGSTQVFLSGVNEDVFFVFSHILQHFYKEGIGLRQICDWCRLLWTYREKIDVKLLEKRLKEAGVMSEWKVFGVLSVEYLGMPVEAMPFYSSSHKWSRKAEKVIGFILETGNFGHNRDYSYRHNHSFPVFKAISMWKHIQDFGRYFVIFPLNAIKVTWHRMILGFSVALKGKKHE